MTLIKLHKILGKMIESGDGRKPVAIDKSSFTHPLELDGTTILKVEDLYLQHVSMSDDDGGVRFNKDGSESTRAFLILSGEPKESSK